jgi:hypothetical protein
MLETLSPQVLKALTDVTGEISLDNAVRTVTRDAVEHRLENITDQLRALEQKYGMPFPQFDAAFQAGTIPNQHNFAIERDYLEWEGLICRERRLQEVREWLR